MQSDGQGHSDPSQPHPARMYDYFLGGTHHYAADQQAGDHVIALVPFIPSFVHMQRRSIQRLAAELVQRRGLDVIIDFAAGLPTVMHFHMLVPDSTTVIYADIDPMVSATGRDLLRDVPNAHFFQGDARTPTELLERPEVQAIVQGRRDIALVHWGILWTFTDAEITRLAHDLYAWAGPGACWAVDFPMAEANPQHPGMGQLIQMYTDMGAPMYVRSLAQCKGLVPPWTPAEPGFFSFRDWHEVQPHDLSETDWDALGPTAGGYGVYLQK